VPRDGLWAAQTPQMFRLGQLRALDAARQAGLAVTDEASAIEALGLQPRLVRCAAGELQAHAARGLRARRNPAEEPPMNIDLRIGEGWDVHRLVEGRALILGGVRIPHSHGLLGHSDADALAHAITDALLGAAGLGDIGRHFPDTAAEFAGADSMVLLARALAAVRQAGWRPVNVDSTVIAQAPKLAPYVEAMRSRLAELLQLDVGCVNVKAKTYEKLGPVGEGQAMEARAVCLLARA
jgi:2-C-methyl-D-erythritol 4-phosphate cytidylyltransferase/2-C-methyl-D-erythritol 2,4-cyclodiphosphate synthase